MESSFTGPSVSDIYIVESPDTIIRVTEYDYQVTDANFKHPVKRIADFHVKRDVVASQSPFFDRLLRSQRLKEANQRVIEIKDDTVASVGVWFRLFHEVSLEPTYKVDVSEMWHIVSVGDKYELKIHALKDWFAEWYNRQDVRSLEE